MAVYGLHGKLKAAPGKGGELAGILAQAVERVRLAPGCLLYLVSINPDEPDAVLVTEVWANKIAHDASLQDETTRALIARARPLLAEPPQGYEITPLAAAGIDLLTA
jgi:quinol monooxygenase YgiN